MHECFIWKRQASGGYRILNPIEIDGLMVLVGTLEWVETHFHRIVRFTLSSRNQTPTSTIEASPKRELPLCRDLQNPTSAPTIPLELLARL